MRKITSNQMMNSPHFHKGKIWDIFPCMIECDENGRQGDAIACDTFINRWFLEPTSWLIVNFMIYIAGVPDPQFRITFEDSEKVPLYADQTEKKG